MQDMTELSIQSRASGTHHVSAYACRVCRKQGGLKAIDSTCRTATKRRMQVQIDIPDI